MRDSDKEELDIELSPMIDPDDWEIVPSGETASVVRPLGVSITARLDAPAAKQVREAARLSGITQAEFVRRAVETAAQTVLDRNLVAAQQSRR
jgi:hypothetical protein